MISENFTDCQIKAIEALNSTQNVFITGPAGCGKSYIIKHFIKNIDDKYFPVLASTGAAAVLVGGRTFHSFFGLGIMEGGHQATVNRALDNKNTVRRIKRIEGFVLDEVSMLSAEVLSAAEDICRKVRDDSSPWGGLRVVAVGDFAQLPPVQKWGPKKWAFMDPLWKRSDFNTVFMKQNVRSEDQHFLDLLKKVRLGVCDTQVENFLNGKQIGDSDDLVGTRLFPRRNQTDAYNMRRLQEIDEELVEFSSEVFGPERYIKQLLQNAPVGEMVSIKRNCRVMIRQNDPRGRWVNGSSGRVEDISSENILVELENGRVANIEKATFSMLDSEGKEVAAIRNFPLSLAYAATIHKSQGMTLDRMIVDLKSLWEPGHAYVALSRVRDPDHIYIQSWSKSSIKADQKVKEFYSDFI